MPNYATPELPGLPNNRTLQEQFFGDHPDLAWQNMLRQQGVNLSPGSRYGNYAVGSFGRLNDQYQTDLFTKNLPLGTSFTDWYSQHGPNIAQEFAGLPSSQRGLNYGAYQGRTRRVGF